MDVLIRDFHERDSHQLLLILERMNRYFESIDPWKELRYDRTNPKYLLDSMQKDTKEKDGIFLVAQVDKDIVGFIHGHMHTMTEDELRERPLTVSSDISLFFVTDSYRGKGIGRKLMESAERYFQNKGCTRIALHVFGPNKLARDIYRKMGFDERGVELVKRFND